MNGFPAAKVMPITRQKKKYTLADVHGGKRERPFRIMVMGTEGVGKSTFAADSPSPAFLCPEDGTNQLDVQRLPTPEEWLDVFDILDIFEDETPFQTLVVDTVDWVEPLIHAHVCKLAGKAAIEDIGFGKGYVAALDHWRSFLARLDALRDRKNLNVILLAHTAIRTFTNPEGDNFDRYELKVHKGAAGLMKEWCDAVLFARREIATAKDGSKAKAFSDGQRVLHTEWAAAYDAKNRYGLPPSIPLHWETFEAAMRAGHGPSARQQLMELLVTRPDLEEQISRGLEWAGSDEAKVARVLNKFRSM